MIDSTKMENARKRRLITALDNLENQTESAQTISLLDFFYEDGLPLNINISDNPLVSYRYKLKSYPEGCWAMTASLKETVVESRTLLEGLKMLITEFLALDLEYNEEEGGFGGISVYPKRKTKETLPVGDVLLQKYMKPRGLGIPTLAKNIGVPEVEIGHIVFNAKFVEESIAEKLANYFSTPKELWLATKPIAV